MMILISYMDQDEGDRGVEDLYFARKSDLIPYAYEIVKKYGKLTVLTISLSVAIVERHDDDWLTVSLIL